MISISLSYDKAMIFAADKFCEITVQNTTYDFTPHKFSKRHKKNIKKLLSTFDKSDTCARFSFKRSFVYITVAIIGASLLTVGTFAYCSKYVFTMGDAKMEDISIQSSIDDKTSIEEVYELTYNLDGYKLTSYSECESSVSACYQKGTHLIEFSQRIISSDDTAFNTEDAVIETIDINGEEAIYIDSTNEYGDSQLLIWTYDGYEFYINCQASSANREFSKEQLIKMAENIQTKN